MEYQIAPTLRIVFHNFALEYKCSFAPHEKVKLILPLNAGESSM